MSVIVRAGEVAANGEPCVVCNQDIPVACTDAIVEWHDTSGYVEVPVEYCIGGVRFDDGFAHASCVAADPTPLYESIATSTGS